MRRKRDRTILQSRKAHRTKNPSNPYTNRNHSPLAKMSLMKTVMVALFVFACVGGGVAQPDISQLGGLDMEGLKQLVGSMYADMQSQIDELKKDKEALQNKTQVVEADNVALRADVQAQIDMVKRDKEALQNKTQVVEAELRHENAALRADIQAQIDVVKKDKEALQNKTQVVEAELWQEKKDKVALWVELRDVRSALCQFSNKTKTNIQQITVRLDHYEAESTTFAQIMEHRRTQEQSSVCGSEALENMLAMCCDSGGPAGNGHRLLQTGCDSLPPMCSLQCSAQFISIFENCQGQPLMEGFSAEDMAQWNDFYGQCQEVQQSAAEMGVLQPVNVRMFRIMISSDAAQSQAEIFGNGGQTQPIIGRLPELPPPPPASSGSGSAEVQEYHARCTTANILTCVPECNATHHGYELLANIDGTDTKFSCAFANMLFSWVGAAALGGFLGRNVQAFVSAVISGAAGTYVLTLTEDADVGTDLVIQPGQNVIISGDRALPQPPTWGSGGFTVGESASLSLTYMQIDAVIGVDEGASQLSFDSCLLLFNDVLVLQPRLSLTMKSTTMTSTETMLLRDGMHASFIEMDAQFGGNPSWVVTKSGETATGQVCDADGTNCVEDLCPVVDCTDGGNPRMNPGAHCVSPQGTCDCGDPQGHGYSGDRCETHACCSELTGELADHFVVAACCCCIFAPRQSQESYCAQHFYHLAHNNVGYRGVGLCDAHNAGWDARCDRNC